MCEMRHVGFNQYERNASVIGVRAVTRLDRGVAISYIMGLKHEIPKQMQKESSRDEREDSRERRHKERRRREEEEEEEKVRVQMQMLKQQQRKSSGGMPPMGVSSGG